MSELTRCNRCTLRDLERRAAARGEQVTTEPDDRGSGIRVFVHPANEAPDRQRHFVAWFMALTDRCAC